MRLFLVFLCLSSFAFAQKDPYGYLSAEDQKYYKNEAGMGMNQLERIDSTVREINKLHGQINALKSEVQSMRKEIDELKMKMQQSGK